MIEQRTLRTLLPVWAGIAILAFAVMAPTASATPVAPADDSHPAPFTWTNGVVLLSFGGESPDFSVASVHQNLVNLSVSAQGMAEVTPGGQIVSVASFSEEVGPWNFTWSNVSGGVVVNLTNTVPVVAASGTWNTSEFPEPSGATSLGNTQVTLSFHLSSSGTSSSWRVKFDVTDTAWPWMSANDSLGLALHAEPHSQSEIAPTSGDGNVTEGENSSGTPVASLTWAKDANVTYASGATAVSTVLGYVGVSDDHMSSQVRLTFAGVAGGYRSLFYDPTVWLNAQAFGTGVPASTVATWVIGATIGAAAIVVGVLVATAWRTRVTPPSTRLDSGPTRAARIGNDGRLACLRCGKPIDVPAGAGVRYLLCSICGSGRSELLWTA